MNITAESLELTKQNAAAINNETFHLQYHILFDIANSYEKGRQLNYVEIGCYAGGSACLMLQRPNTNVISIDLGGPIPKERVMDNVSRLNKHNNNYQYIEANSQYPSTANIVKELLNGGKIDILFIDGDHSYAGVQNDFQLYSKMVSNGGYIVFDDYNDHLYSPEVRPAVDAINFQEYDVLGQYGNEFVVRKKIKTQAIFTLLYNEYEIIERSMQQLRNTNTLNLPIYAVDNAYPFLTVEMVERLKSKYNITIIGERYNRGLSAGYNELINTLNFDFAILYDCDSYPITQGWDAAMMDVIQHENVKYLCLMFDICRREMIERGYHQWHYMNYEIWQPTQACTQSISCADLKFLRNIGGLEEPKKYYGGLESTMFKHWNDINRIGYLNNYFENQINNVEEVNPLYRQYKWEYAHKGYDGSFDDFIKARQ